MKEQKPSHSEVDDKDDEIEPDRSTSSILPEILTIENKAASFNERTSSTFKSSENHSSKPNGNVFKLFDMYICCLQYN